MKNEVTVLIPTRNRSKFLKRSLSYYKSVKINCNFIIGDSSTDLLFKTRSFTHGMYMDRTSFSKLLFGRAFPLFIPSHALCEKHPI